MSEAPERIYFVKYGDFRETPSDRADDVEYIRADIACALPAVQPHVNETPKTEQDREDVLTPDALTAEAARKNAEAIARKQALADMCNEPWISNLTKIRQSTSGLMHFSVVRTTGL